MVNVSVNDVVNVRASCLSLSMSLSTNIPSSIVTLSTKHVQK